MGIKVSLIMIRLTKLLTECLALPSVFSTSAISEMNSLVKMYIKVSAPAKIEDFCLLCFSLVMFFSTFILQKHRFWDKIRAMKEERRS